jgi:hypothetical protein
MTTTWNCGISRPPPAILHTDLTQRITQFFEKRFYRFYIRPCRFYRFCPPLFYKTGKTEDPARDPAVHGLRFTSLYLV